jgi:4-aminobutyrate aminotransferase-like enzyme/Ser/Thr protein kinase RdoA (MazF antagonist)
VSLLEHTPALTPDRAQDIARSVYGIAATALPLPSERDQNFRLDVDGTPTYVLKVANRTESLESLAAQHGAAARARAAGLPVQRVHRSLDGGDTAIVEGHVVRLLDWLPGVPLADVRGPSTELLEDLGRLVGRHARALDGYDHPGAHRDFHWDVARAVHVLGERRTAIAAQADRALVDGVLADQLRIVVPVLPRLRTAVVHGDANDRNVLVDAGDASRPGERYRTVCGLLDYGDLVHTVRVAEVAVAGAYVAIGATTAGTDPLDAVARLTAGFHAEQPLEPDELAVLWHLVQARLAMSVCHAAVQSPQRPDDPYLRISEDGAWAALRRARAVHPRLAHYRLRDACGLDPHPDGARVRAHLAAATPAPLLGRPWSQLATFPVDLSVGSPVFGAQDVDATPERFDALVRGAAGVDAEAVGVGGYGEARLVYTTPAFAPAEPAGERRTVHLAVDVWAPAGTAVHAPLAGTVVVAHDNAQRLDYGPVVVLRHTTDDGVPFHSLYGHLSEDTLTQVAVGSELAAGDVLGRVGTPPQNGDWAPHVHVQVIVDLLDRGHDYPGVGEPSLRPLWLGLSPDPGPLLGLVADAVPAPVRPLSDTLADRRRRLGPSLSLAYEHPLRIVRGIGPRLYDDEGRSYLDAVNNVAHVGHAHPRVVAAGARQMAVLNTNTRYLHETVLAYAERIVATLPNGLDVCFFVNSGSEANELALRLVRTATGAADVICLQDGYHGHTQALVDVSPYKHDGPGGRGRPPWVHTARLPDPYRGPYRGRGRDTARAYAGDVRRCVDEVAATGARLAGMIAEPMVGCGGQVVLPDGYLAEAAAVVRSAGGLFVADEVQVGFGRVGPAFWGFATQDVVPDVVTMGKPAGDGHPIGIVVTTRAVADAFANGMEYFNTFGGNPVSAAVGLAVLDVLRDERLPERAADLGERLLAGAWDLAARHPVVGDARGLGLYAGIELVRDRDTLEPAGPEAAYVVERMRDRGVLLSTDGPAHNVLKIKPPLVWTEAEVDELLGALDEVLGDQALAR